MAEIKREHCEGADGRIYFRYAKGASYHFIGSDGVPLFEYTVQDCAYRDGEEWYALACNGRQLSQEKTSEQTALIFSFFDYEIITPGTPQELPLLDEEVKAYYTDLGKEARKANVEANAKLKDTEYFKLKAQIDKLSPALRFAQSEGNTQKAEEIAEKIRATAEKQHKILEGCGVDIDILTKKKKCSICSDTGFLPDGTICECALARSDEIKRYNAELRLARRKNLGENHE